MDLRKAPQRLGEYVRGFLRTGRPGVRIGRGVRRSGPGRWDLEPGSIISAGCRIYVGPGATFTMKRGAGLGDRVIVNVHSGITLLEGTSVSWDCNLLDTDFHAVAFGGREGPISKPIVLGPRVLVGTGSIVLKGVTGRAESVVAAGSVVRRGFPANSMVAGNPAKIIGRIDGWRD